jgi:hypothetical protein|nr:MAG TPA: holin protein [Caudoviricetes sp.]
MTNEIVITIVCSVFASTGFWAFVTAIMQNREKKVSAEGKMLRGLAHDRICNLGEEYIKQGYISKDDYENLHDYLFLPYEELGGNGTAKRIMDEVKKLPLREEEKTK